MFITQRAPPGSQGLTVEWLSLIQPALVLQKQRHFVHENERVGMLITQRAPRGSKGLTVGPGPAAVTPCC